MLGCAICMQVLVVWQGKVDELSEFDLCLIDTAREMVKKSTAALFLKGKTYTVMTNKSKLWRTLKPLKKNASAEKLRERLTSALTLPCVAGATELTLHGIQQDCLIFQREVCPSSRLLAAALEALVCICSQHALSGYPPEAHPIVHCRRMAPSRRWDTRPCSTRWCYPCG